MFKRSKKVFAGFLSALMLMTTVPISQLAANAEEVRENNYLGTARKSQYVLYSSSKDNGIQLNGTKYIINGNVHSNSNLYAYLNTADVRGKLETVGKVVNYNNGVKQYIKKENAPQRVLIDPKEAIMTSLGATPTTFDNWQTYSGTDVSNAGPIHAKSGLQFCGTNISLKDTIVCDNSILVSASNAFNSAENGEVNLYSTNGNISIYTNKTVLNGIIYAPNGTVQITGSDITINGMIIAKEIQISADKVTLNQNLKLSLAKAIDYYNEALQIYAEADYTKETSTINLNWQSTFEKGKFDIYSSTDGVNFATLATVNDVATYAYPTNGATNDIYFRVKETLDNGFTKDSNDVKMVYNTTKGEYELSKVDTDGEKLIDTDEFFLETDKTKVDTDGDGLSDYAEVNLTGTDPLYVDSDENGVLDGDEDPDGDTLTNLKEIELGTNPRSNDTDEDGLTDNDELNIYKTSPIKADTDGDTINDGDELKLGLNPLLVDSDGDGIPDNKEMIEQKIDYTEKKPDSKIPSINLEINAAGYAPETTTIENVKDKDTYSSKVVGIIGDPFRIETTSEFETAKLTFKVDKSKLGSTNFNDLKMMWYNEATGFYEYFNDTVLDETSGTITTTTTHFCTILIVDGKAFEGSFAEDLYSAHKETKTTKYNYNTLIAIDSSNNMKKSDPYEIYEYNPNGSTGSTITRRDCARRDIVEKLLLDLNEKPRQKVSLCIFDSSITPITKFTNDYYLNPFLQSRFDSNRISQEFDVNYNTSINEMIALLKNNDTTRTEGNITYKTISTIMFISDGEGTISNTTLQNAKNNGIIINTVAVPTSQGMGTLQRIATNTGGNFYSSQNSVSLTQTMSDETSSNLDVTTDYDGDGLPDLFEKAGMKCTNGRTLYSDYDTKFSDTDYLEDGQEVQMVKNYQYSQPYAKCQYLFTEISDPKNPDTDGDGYRDHEDAEPLNDLIDMSYIFYKSNGDKFIADEAFDREKKMKSNSQKVMLFPANSFSEFQADWNSMGLENGKGKYRITNVYTIYHGEPNGFHLGEYDINDGKNKVTINDWVDKEKLNSLNNKKIETLNLTSCNNGNLDFLNDFTFGEDYKYQNMAIQFLKAMPDIKNVYAWDGSAFYSGGNEYSAGDPISIFIYENEHFKKWSLYKNGRQRYASQLIHYYRDPFGKIVFSPNYKNVVNKIVLYSFNCDPRKAKEGIDYDKKIITEVIQ